MFKVSWSGPVRLYGERHSEKPHLYTGFKKKNTRNSNFLRLVYGNFGYQHMTGWTFGTVDDMVAMTLGLACELQR